VSVFRKKRSNDDDAELGDDVETTDGAEPADETAADDEQSRPAPTARPGGPFDISEVDDVASSGRVDLGGLWLPGRPGLEVRIEADQETAEVVAVSLVLGEGALQVQPFAAPRSEGIWDDVRAEIRVGITRQGGTADEVEGPLGTELRTRVPVRAADGSQAVQPARFVGVDGPRWFLRGVITGRPAVEPETDGDLIELFRDIVVVRGSDPMAPRDPIGLHLPTETVEAADEGDGDDAGGAGSTDDLKPFERGPEITEIH
jgi:hypothetical protein